MDGGGDTNDGGTCDGNDTTRVVNEGSNSEW